MSSERHIQHQLDDMGIDADVQTELDPEQVEPRPGDDHDAALDEDEELDFRKERITRVETHHPDHGEYRTEVNTYLLTDGSMIKEEVRHRLQCPTCSNVLEDPEKNETMHPRRCGLDDCTVYRCPNCEGICQSCDTPLCPRHSTGHATKDETYCFECVGDIEEELRHQRELDRKKAQRQMMQERRQHQQQKWQVIKELVKLYREKQDQETSGGRKREGEKDKYWWNHPSNPDPVSSSSSSSDNGDPFEKVRRKYR